MLWHEQTWPTIASLDKDTPVVIPLGSVEQHGHHLPVFVDTIQVTEIASRVEQRLGDDALFLPTQWLGSSHHHLDFPGTISMVPSLYSQMIKSIALCIINAGFKRIFFLNGHGGNQVPGAQALTELVAENDEADATYLAFSSWWHVGGDGIKPEKHNLTTPFVSHACEYETSMMLFLRGDLVKMDRFKKTHPPLATKWFHIEQGGPVGVFTRYQRQTIHGNLGAGENATREKGEAMTGAVVDEVVAFLHDYRQWPMLEKIGPK
jgi:creatinine amidohydrolase